MPPPPAMLYPWGNRANISHWNSQSCFVYLFIAAFALFARTVHTAKAKRNKTNKQIQKEREGGRENERDRVSGRVGTQ